MKYDYCDWKQEPSTNDFARLFNPRPGRHAYAIKQNRWTSPAPRRSSLFTAFEKENRALDRIIEDSKWITAANPLDDEIVDRPSIETWERATEYLRRMALHADMKNYDLPLPRIVPAQDASVDLLWKSGHRGLLINFPDEGRRATYYGKNSSLQTSGVLFTDDAHDELIRWLIF